MSDLKPGTPEYQEAYDKEMQRLEAEATKPTAKADDKATETTSTGKEAAKAEAKPEAKTETAQELAARLEKAEKALKDTQRWGHDNAARVKKLEKEAADRKRAEAKPPILEANPGLEDAIKHVAQVDETTKPMETWLQSVAHAIPDVEDLLGDKDFYAKASAKKTEFGAEWDNPLTAIRELSALRTEHLTTRNVQAAVESARKDFEVKSKKRSAMEVPGGSGGKDAPPQEDDAVKRFRTMSTEEFAKERSRVMGY